MSAAGDVASLPMTPIRLTAQQARLLHLHAQGLLTRPRRRARKTDVLAAIERMRLLQIDTIHVVARSPYLVLFSRLGHYAPQWLDELLAETALFECWSHEACFAPVVDFAWHQGARSMRGHHWSMKHALRTRNEHGAAIERLLGHIRQHGPVKAADFVRQDGGGSPWWGWKDEKRWLESAFALGELMVARRENFQRVYDLSERVIGAVRPDWNETPESEAVLRWQVLAAACALGVSQARWLADYFRQRDRLDDEALAELGAAGELIPVVVDGWLAPAYVHRDHRDALMAAAAGRLRGTRTCLLSPFDPVVWDRERARVLFDFDYTLECYLPEPKRRWGYFVLPILRRGRLVGRVDAKAHRGDGVFEVKRLYLEAGTVADEALVADLAQALRESAQWHGCTNITLGRSDPRDLSVCLRRQLKELEST